MSEIALFPLSSILMPLGRMSLQIFEQRYLDLVARCMRERGLWRDLAQAGFRGIGRLA